ncbi:MAG: membrane protein insertion efficiency factor YidD [Desulfosarcina sp.]|jgi:putative membrane protein insertion efficiency factor
MKTDTARHRLRLCTMEYDFVRIFFIGLIFCLLAGSAWADMPAAQPVADSHTPVAAAPIRLFQKFLSGADGNRCPMTPSCSSYAIQAIQRHGAVKGWIMACDRLMRCGHDEIKLSPAVMTRHGVRSRDPLDNNDFWLP